MKKTISIIAASLILALSLAGCSSSGDMDSNTADSQATETQTTDSSTAKTDADKAKEEAEALDNVAADADENIDMSKVEGTDAETVDDANSKGEAGDTEVEITDAKVINYNDQNVIVISYEFKNKTGRETSFENNVETLAYQDDVSISPAVVVGVEGISCETLGQRVKNGGKITVQKAFLLNNTTDDVTVTVDDINNISPTAPVSKTFKISQ